MCYWNWEFYRGAIALSLGEATADFITGALILAGFFYYDCAAA